MTDIEQKALELVNEVCREGCWDTVDLYRARIEYGGCFEALCRAIEQHEAFRQEVSDAIQRVAYGEDYASLLLPFIIPEPDPLLEALNELPCLETPLPEDAAAFRAAIEKRGGKIVWDQDQ